MNDKLVRPDFMRLLEGIRSSIQPSPDSNLITVVQTTGPLLAPPETPPTQTDLQVANRSLLFTLYQSWLTATHRPVATRYDAELAVRELIAFSERQSSDPLVRRTILDFRDDLRQRRGLRAKTVAKKIGLICAMLQLATDDDEQGSIRHLLVRLHRWRLG